MSEEQVKLRVDAAKYGIGIVRDGRRVDPFDVFVRPPEKKPGQR